jgi:hypothetical protein
MCDKYFFKYFGILLVLFVAFFVNVSAMNDTIVDLGVQDSENSSNIHADSGLATGETISELAANKDFRTKAVLMISFVLLFLVLLFFILVFSVFRK